MKLMYYQKHKSTMSIISNTCSIMLKETKKKRYKGDGIIKHEIKDKMLCNKLILSKRQKRQGINYYKYSLLINSTY